MPTPSDVVSWLPDDKRTHDLQGLLAMVRYASAGTCRKQAIHAHFGFPQTVPCGTCDVCENGDTWMTHKLPNELVTIAPVVAEEIDDLPVQRGDWIEVQGLGLCCVRRVHKTRGSLRADVEQASDLTERSVDLLRRRWRKVQG